MRDREEAANQRAGFLEQGFGAAWMEGAHTDIVVKPGNGPPIPAHKAILVSRPPLSIITVGPLGFRPR